MAKKIKVVNVEASDEIGKEIIKAQRSLPRRQLRKKGHRAFEMLTRSLPRRQLRKKEVFVATVSKHFSEILAEVEKYEKEGKLK